MRLVCADCEEWLPLQQVVQTRPCYMHLEHKHHEIIVSVCACAHTRRLETSAGIRKCLSDARIGNYRDLGACAWVRARVRFYVWLVHVHSSRAHAKKDARLWAYLGTDDVLDGADLRIKSTRIRGYGRAAAQRDRGHFRLTNPSVVHEFHALDQLLLPVLKQAGVNVLEYGPPVCLLHSRRVVASTYLLDAQQLHPRQRRQQRMRPRPLHTGALLLSGREVLLLS